MFENYVPQPEPRKITVTYTFNDKKVVIDADDREKAELSFKQIVAEYFPHLNGAKWTRTITTREV